CHAKYSIINQKNKISSMSKLVFLAFILYSAVASAQQKHDIDSVNSLSFEENIKRSAQLDDVFLKNASVAKKIGYKMGEADSYRNLSLVYYYQGKYNKNVDYSLKAIDIYEEIGAHSKLAYQYAGLGYEMKRRNMGKALQYM